jgi:AcrR family transcriptional regulator
VHNVTVAERWTRERRRQHTRDVLLDAAEEVFARRGFDGASLDEIADAAGYTRGAIYKHFGSKDELFLAVNHRFNERSLEGFREAFDFSIPIEELDLAAIAKRWYDLQHHEPHFYALGTEFNLYVLRNPEVRERVTAQRRAIAEMIAGFMDEHSARLGVTMRIPSITIARIVLACADGLELASQLDPGGSDLYEPFLELLVSAWDTGGQQPPSR